MAEIPNLRVIDNSEPIHQTDWLNFPETVNARSPYNKTERCSFRVARADLLKQAKVARRQPAYEFWSNIVGKPPPVAGEIEPPNDQLSTLWDAYACWQGIERPCGHDGSGASLVAYCIRARATYNFTSRPPATYAKLLQIPKNVGFVAFAKLDEPPNHQVKGVLTHWQFIQMDVNNPDMPMGHGERFAKRLW